METDSILKPPKSRSLKSGRVRLDPGEEIGEHVTEKREELIVVLKGRADVEEDGRTIELHEGDAHFIPEGKMHNVRNTSGSGLEYIYIVTLFDGDHITKP